MKNRILAVLLLLIPCMFTSCGRHGVEMIPIPSNYLIIGHPGGFVANPVLTFYLLTDNTLMADTNVPYANVPDSYGHFNFNVPAPAAKYAKVKGLLHSVPAELLTKNNQHFGNLFPDAGYTDIRLSVNGQLYRWYFEADLSGVSTEVKQFVTDAEQVFN